MTIQSLDLIYVGEFTENKKFSKINFHFLTNFYYRLLSAVKSAFLQCYITYGLLFYRKAFHDILYNIVTSVSYALHCASVI